MNHLAPGIEQLHAFLNGTIRSVGRTGLFLAALLSVQYAHGQGAKGKITEANAEKASLQDSMDLYNNAKAVQDFYEKSGQYIKTNEYRLNSNDLAKIHAANDKKYAEVLRTINNERFTPQGKRKISAEEYRINIDKYRYKQRELSDYVLNTDAPMQLFDRRIAPQVLIDYTFKGDPKSLINNDDVDFNMYDPVAVKPYSMLTPEEKVVRDMRYPRAAKPESKPAPEEKTTDEPKRQPKAIKQATQSEYIISGPVPDSVRFKRFKTKKEAEDFIKTLPAKSEGE
jgi:hypothetical protein